MALNLGQEAKVSKLHSRTIIQTYLVLGIAFSCMLGINIYAYYTIINMSETYTSLENSAINIELTTTRANLLFREIVSGYTKDKDMNDVWDLIREANENAAKLDNLESKEKMNERISKFNDIMVKFYKFYRNPESDINVDVAAKFRNEYEAAYMNVIGAVDAVKDKLKELIINRMFTFRVLYMALLVNFLLLFWFTIITFRRYINRRKQAEVDLVTAKNDIDIIINSLDSMVITVDPHGVIKQWNKAAEVKLERTAERVIGKAVWIALPFLMPYKTKIETMPLSGKSEAVYGEKIVSNNQRYFNLSLNALSREMGVVIRLDDITEHQMKDEQLRHAQKMEVVKNLIGGLANDFNNVLGAITGTISMMRYSSQNNGARTREDLENDINLIESSTERAVVMVQHLLSLATEREVSLEPVDLNEVVIHVLKICQNTFDKRIELDAELYDLKVLVKADPAEIEQCLLNLCDNAAQAMTTMRPQDRDWGGKLSVAIEIVYPDKSFKAEHPNANQSSYWCIKIADTGIGMDHETMSRVFDPFFSTKDRNASTGLGLTMVKEIVERHNGFLEMESTQGKGTEFRIYLPELAKTADEESDRQVVPVSATDQIPTGSGLIFVVDDEEIMRKTAGSILEKLGYTIVYAEDGEEAVNIYQEKYQEIRVVLLDMAMPKMSGKDAYVEMKKINPDIKAILVSGFKKDDRIMEALELGINSFIQKPYSMVTLAQEVKKYCMAG